MSVLIMFTCWSCMDRPLAYNVKTSHRADTNAHWGLFGSSQKASLGRSMTQTPFDLKKQVPVGR